MKMTSMVLATSLALVPATVAFADDAKKEALKKAKEAAKEKAIEKAKEKSREKVAHAEAHAAATTKTPAVDTAAMEAEKQTHARNVGAIERLQQIADATSNGDLKTIVQRLSDKETKRHTLAS